MSLGQPEAPKQEELKDELNLGDTAVLGDTETHLGDARTSCRAAPPFVPTKQGQDGLESLGGKP